MRVMTTHTTSELAATRELRAMMHGRVVLRSDDTMLARGRYGTAQWRTVGSNGAEHRQWAQDLWKSLAPFALPGGYANFLVPRDREQVRDAYGSNGVRLRALKLRFDPDGVFASAIPLPE